MCYYLYLYIKVIILYCISSTTTTAMVAFRSPCYRLMGEYRANRLVIRENDYIGEVLMVDIVSGCIAFLFVLIWFFSRNTSQYAFILQV